MCSEADPSKASGPCPLCIKERIGSTKQYCKHIGDHLKQLSLFALPQVESDGNESSSQDDGMKENPHASSRSPIGASEDTPTGGDGENYTKDQLIDYSREGDANINHHDNRTSNTGLGNFRDEFGFSPIHQATPNHRGDIAAFDSHRTGPKRHSYSDSSKWRWACVSYSSIDPPSLSLSENNNQYFSATVNLQTCHIIIIRLVLSVLMYGILLVVSGQ
ncbi:hypothetical protein F5Y09DRAFT_322465 [Xylaria sp. FL1042]|nr:hypothetical protein F5Y09DRAFT_322465 [Xylaria sp. FL1042]